MACLLASSHTVDAVLPASILAPEGIGRIPTPPYLGSTSGVSRLRPIAWLAYSRFFFPVPSSQRILCTTHHVLPRHKHQIVTVHDLRPYFYPDSGVQRFYFHHMLPSALQRCEGILTVSETSRQMLVDLYHLDPALIRVVPNALTLAPPSLAALSTPPQQPGYLLMVGATWMHKNADELLRMHLHWAGRFRLKIVAGPGAYRNGLQSLAADLGLAAKVDFLSGLAEDQLQSLYAHCAALVYPSRMEGFGLPPLEAMAQGRPVIVSDIPTFREIYGPHATYVTLGDESSWAHAFASLHEPGPSTRAQLIAHSRNFTQDRMKTALDAALTCFWP